MYWICNLCSLVKGKGWYCNSIFTPKGKVPDNQTAVDNIKQDLMMCLWLSDLGRVADYLARITAKRESTSRPDSCKCCNNAVNFSPLFPTPQNSKLGSPFLYRKFWKIHFMQNLNNFGLFYSYHCINVFSTIKAWYAQYMFKDAAILFAASKSS